MPRWTVEYVGNGHEEFDAKSARDAREQAVRRHFGSGRDIIEVRPFAAKLKAAKHASMPTISVKPDPFEKLKALLP